MDHHKAMRQGVVLIGMATSLLLLSITMFVSISTNSSRGTISFKAIDQTSANQNTRPLAHATNTPTPKQQALTISNEKILQDIDELYAYEESLSKQPVRTTSDINALINIVEAETTYTRSKQSYLPPSEFQALTQELESVAKTLQQLRTESATISSSELRSKVDVLNIQTLVLPRNQLRRTVALLSSYNYTLQEYFTLYEKISLQSPETKIFTSVKDDFDTCIATTRTTYNKAQSAINGSSSKLLEFETLNTQQATQHARSLRTELAESKKQLDLTRNELQSCLSVLQP